MQVTSSVVEVYRQGIRHLNTWGPMSERVLTGVEQLPHNFTADWLSKEVTFLDAWVYVKNGKVETDLHVKPTSRHQYVHTKSCHPKHCKTAIRYSQALRIKRICSEREIISLRTNQLKDHLSKRGYSEQLLDLEINRAISTPDHSSL